MKLKPRKEKLHKTKTEQIFLNIVLVFILWTVPYPFSHCVIMSFYYSPIFLSLSLIKNKNPKPELKMLLLKINSDSFKIEDLDAGVN